MGGVAKYGGPYGMVRGIGTDARFWDLRTKNVGERRSVVEGEYLARLTLGLGVADDERRRKDKNDGDSFGGNTAFISGALRLFMKKMLPLSRREPSVSNRISETVNNTIWDMGVRQQTCTCDGTLVRPIEGFRPPFVEPEFELW